MQDAQEVVCFAHDFADGGGQCGRHAGKPGGEENGCTGIATAG